MVIGLDLPLMRLTLLGTGSVVGGEMRDYCSRADDGPNRQFALREAAAVLHVKLEADAFSVKGMVRLGYVPAAIARANGASNLADAERKLWPYLNAAVVSGALKPLHEEHLTPLPAADYGAGVVPFHQLQEWGISAGLFQFGAEETLTGAPAPRLTPSAPASSVRGMRDRESQEHRQARRYEMCVAAGLKMPASTYGKLPRGIGQLAKREGISRQAFAEDVKAHIGRLHGR